MMNPNCDGSGPCTSGVVRVLPIAGGGNAILCHADYAREMAWRRRRNRDLGEFARYDLPEWETLEIHKGEEAPRAIQQCDCGHDISAPDCETEGCEGHAVFCAYRKSVPRLYPEDKEDSRS